MRIVTPELAWHFDVDSTTSIDFHPFENLLVVAGSDSTGQNVYLRVWEIDLMKLIDEYDPNDLKKKNEMLQNIFKLQAQISTGHLKSVNCVRFSPNGLNFASGADDTKLIIWVKKIKPKAFGSREEVITWGESKILTGHGKEVYDLRWSKNGRYIVSCSLDFSTAVWNVEKGQLMQKLAGHCNYVKGVCFDPKGTNVVSLSTDRSIRVYKMNHNTDQFFCKSHVKRIEFTKPEGAMEEEGTVKAFRFLMDENLIETFFRRPDWSPDGSFFLIPGAQYLSGPDEEAVTCVALFTRGKMSEPSYYFPVYKKPAILVKFCPLLFKRKEGDFNLFDLPYHMVWAIASTNKIYIFKTSSQRPLYVCSNMHYATLTDLSWKDDRCVTVSSMDGYISFAMFSKGELGERLDKKDYPEFMLENYKKTREEIAADIESRKVKKVLVAQNEQKVMIKNGRKVIVPRKLN